MAETGVQRKYKDRLFCHLFSDRDNALSLFNAVSGTDYTDADGLKIVTLEDAVYLTMKNDLAVCIHSWLKLFEQQSSWNPNMPLRGFLYFAREFSGWLTQNRKDLYGTRLVKIPAPEYYVLYNGRREEADRQDLLLSDAFGHKVSGYEWTAHVININAGHTPDVMEKCRTLKEYSLFIDEVRREQDSGQALEDSVREAVNRCIRNGVLSEYLLKNKAEVSDMILTEYDEDLHTQTLLAEGREEGREEGRREMVVEFARQGVSEVTISAATKLSVEQVRKILEEESVTA